MTIRLVCNDPNCDFDELRVRATEAEMARIEHEDQTGHSVGAADVKPEDEVDFRETWIREQLGSVEISPDPLADVSPTGGDD